MKQEPKARILNKHENNGRMSSVYLHIGLPVNEEDIDDEDWQCQRHAHKKWLFVRRQVSFPTLGIESTQKIHIYRCEFFENQTFIAI